VREIFNPPRQEGVHSMYECIELSDQGTKCPFRLKIRDVNEVNIFTANCRAHKMKCASFSQDMRGVYKRIGKHSHKLDKRIYYNACVRAHMYDAVQVDLDKDLKEVCDDAIRLHRYICCSYTITYILRKMRSRLTHMENQNVIFWFGALESVAQS